MRDRYFTGQVHVEKIAKLNKYRVRITDTLSKVIDQIYTPYTIFQMEQGDVNMDGRTDICIGIIKPTPFDPVPKKRLFIFQVDQGYIRPLWLGSRLSRSLESFNVSKNDKEECIIRTLEKQDEDRYCISTYKWKSFGMAYIETERDSLSYSQAITEMK